MERSRRLANKAILKGLISSTKVDSHLRFLSSISHSFSLPKPENTNGNNQKLSHNVPSRSISLAALKPSDTFPRRHNSATSEEQTKMAQTRGFDSLDSLIDTTVLKSIGFDMRLQQAVLNPFNYA